MSKHMIAPTVVSIACVIAFVAAVNGDPRAGEYPQQASAAEGALVREHSPVTGPVDAPVTIVQFLDPACEHCRAVHPVVEQMLSEHPDDVRLVTRYIPSHSGADEVVEILEAARLQGVYEPVRKALLDIPAKWHLYPQYKRAWKAAQAAGLDLAKAQEQVEARSWEIAKLIKVDAADARALGVSGTSTIFVNGRPLPDFAPEQLTGLVKSEVGSVQISEKNDPVPEVKTAKVVTSTEPA